MHDTIKLRFLLLLSLIVHIIAPNSSSYPEEEWHTVLSPPFRIHYLDSDKPHIERLASLHHDGLRDLQRMLKLHLHTHLDIYICPTDDIFKKLTGNFIPDWGEGVADARRGLIILKSPALTQHHDRLHKLIRHELTHILIGQAVPSSGALPKWFNEGMAIYLSSDDAFAVAKSLSKALITDSIIPLDEIDEVLQFHQAKAQLAYEESYSFTNYLAERFGFDRLAALIGSVQNGVPFQTAFVNTFGIDLFDAEIAWYDDIENKYRWHFLKDFEIFLWIFILFLFILGGMAVRLRNRRTLRKWEEEERLAN